MADPFAALHHEIVDVAPRVDFAAHLRARVVAALALPKGVTVSDTTNADPANPDLTAPSEGIRHGDVGYASLWVPDARQAQRFFAAVLGWPAEGHRMASGAAVDHGFAGGVTPATLFVNYVVDDLDAALERVRESGGTHEPPTDEPWGPSAMCGDPGGLRFALFEVSGGGPRRPRPTGQHHGDLWYITMEVADTALARAFYGSVLGWAFEPGHVADGWGVSDVAPLTGMHGIGRASTPAIVPMYRVDDIAEAVIRVRAAGGSAPEPQRQPYGWQTLCTDDQGTRFYLGQE